MYRFKIKGVVQGVGFRPYIYNTCSKTGLCGFVQNTGDGVVVEVDNKEAFEHILKSAPENARIDHYEIEEIDAAHESFTIRKSEGEGHAEIPPDFYTCTDCISDMHDPKNRRFGYFFTTCTNCGPRFSTTRKAPYDRDTTTMDAFPMCKECTSEYEDPNDRRYHAQTIACHNCGPTLTLYHNNERLVVDDPILKTAELLNKGEVIAIKGVGGYHLACNTSPEAVSRLKKITGRSDKPFALMCKDMEMVARVAEPTAKETELMQSKERPIVLAKKKGEEKHISELDSYGIMLPYTALHYLLFDRFNEPLVLTSSNRSNEPISTTKEEQLAHYVLDHDREIVNAVDDSVIKVIHEKPFFIRRSRGFVPQSIEAEPGEINILALGAEMSNTFAIYNKEGCITLSQYMGNTSNVQTFERYKEAIYSFLAYTNTEPDLIVADLHPLYNTSQYADTLAEEKHIPVERVQHHTAHAYGLAREHNLSDFVAIISDGMGYGTDGSIWGGEIFDGSKRIGHLEEQVLLGGDSATRFPAKILFSILRKFLTTLETEKYMRRAFEPSTLTLLDKQLKENFNAPLTTSTGRIFDAMSFLLGYCDERTYDGRPALLLEAHAHEPFDIEPVIEDNILMTTPLFEYVIQHMDEKPSHLAATTFLYVAKGLYTIAAQQNKPILWSGGVAYNSLMTSYLMEQGVKTHVRIPPGDGGISFGQISYILSHTENKKPE